MLLTGPLLIPAAAKAADDEIAREIEKLSRLGKNELRGALENIIELIKKRDILIKNADK